MRLAVLLSGGGTTLQNLIDRIDAGTLDARITLVLASRRDAFGLERAARHDIPRATVPRRGMSDVDRFSDAVFSHIRTSEADLVCLAGFMSLLRIPDDFAGRVLNVHPALLPAFGGKGMYGARVHQAVLDHGAKVTGCTVHLADNTYDTGPILAQRCCDVLDEDTPEALAARVGQLERDAYPQVIQAIHDHGLRLLGRRALLAS